MAVTGNASQMVFRAKGKSGKVKVTDPYISIEQTDEGAVVTVTDAHGSTQATIYNGVGIDSIEKTATQGLVDTYTITFTDGSTTTYNVTNGTHLTDEQMSGIDKVVNTLSSGTQGQFLMSDGNGGFTWVNLDDLNVYPKGVSLS